MGSPIKNEQPEELQLPSVFLRQFLGCLDNCYGRLGYNFGYINLEKAGVEGKWHALRNAIKKLIDDEKSQEQHYVP
jgi:hypothetical protein